MKKVLLVACVMGCAMALSVNAQTGIRFGVKAGYNLAMQYGTMPPDVSYDVDSDGRHGFAGGIFLLFPITEAFSVQQEYLYVNKGSVQHVDMEVPPVSTKSSYNINYFEMPILFRYTFAKIGDVGFYGSSGFTLSLLLNGEWEVGGTFDTGDELVPFSSGGNTDMLDKFDYSFIYGLGVKFKLFNQNIFFDYRQTIGWNTLLMPTGEGGDPAPLRNQSYTFAVGIYF